MAEGAYEHGAEWPSGLGEVHKTRHRKATAGRVAQGSGPAPGCWWGTAASGGPRFPTLAVCPRMQPAALEDSQRRVLPWALLVDLLWH